jgi:hypothetical protein
VKTIDAKAQNIVELPEDIGNLHKLTSLHSKLCQVAKSKPCLAMSNHVKCVVSQNLLTMLPKSVGNWLYVTLIDLEFNRLVTLPAEFGNLRCLEYCNLRSNELVYLPPTMRKLISLSLFNLCGNERLGKLSVKTDTAETTQHLLLRIKQRFSYLGARRAVVCVLCCSRYDTTSGFALIGRDVVRAIVRLLWGKIIAVLFVVFDLIVFTVSVRIESRLRLLA